MLANTPYIFTSDTHFAPDSDLSLAEAKPHIFLAAKPRYSCQTMDAQFKQGLKERGRDLGKQTLFPHFSVGADVVFIPCYDGKDTRSFILQTQIDDWHTTVEEIKSIALKNINTLVPETSIHKLDSQGVGACWAYKVKCELGYASSLILQPNLIKQLRVNGAHLVGLLDTDTLVVTGSQDLVGIALLATLMEEAQAEEKSLPPIPVLIRDQVEKWEPNDQCSSLEKAVLEVTKTLFDRLEIVYFNDLYGDQKERLEALKTEPRVASFIAARDATGAVWSLCCVAEGEYALLPETSRVTLGDKKGYSTTVSWNTFASMMGKGLTRTEHYPARYLATTFPTTSQLLIAPRL